MTTSLPKEGRTLRIWKVVEQLILDRYEQIKDERMRTTYYLIREWLEAHRAEGTILDAEFDYFLEHYEYYRDDKWPKWEKQHGIRRPETKPPTIVIDQGTEYTEQRIYDAWDRARGFIFIEKSGMASDLTPLSEHGWLIVSAQGESTRTFREKAANDGTDRPILAITDADFYGGSITDSLEGFSRRTSHLGLWKDLMDRVQEIGLTQADADALDLPRERDPTKSPDEWRTELDSLAVLKERHDLATPLLAYVAAKMGQLDIPLCPLPIEDPDEVVEDSLETGIRSALRESIEDVVASVLEGTDRVDDLSNRGEGDLMELRIGGAYQDDDVELSPVQDELETIAKSKLESLVWWRQSRYEEHVRDEIGEPDVATIEGLLA